MAAQPRFDQAEVADIARVLEESGLRLLDLHGSHGAHSSWGAHPRRLRYDGCINLEANLRGGDVAEAEWLARAHAAARTLTRMVGAASS